MRDASEVSPIPGELPARRTVARVVFVDDHDAVLLLSGRDPAHARAREFWFTPGGGTEPGETLEDAARREVYEEVGCVVDALGPVAWQRSSDFEFDGVAFAQDESFFVVHTARFDARRVAWTDFESRSISGWRWWPVADLVAVADSADLVVYPPALGVLVEEWLRSGPPARPVPIA
ncbi:MAG: NUDIX hydrolase [Acidimicrobiales bacterium]